MVDASTKREVRRRAGNRCEYCLLPQHASPFLTFHVEHIHAQQHVDDDSLDNLALACPSCNLNKGPNPAGLDPETRVVIPLFHPRQDTWDDHFDLVGAEIVGLTPVGKTTARLLCINSAEQLEIRTGLIDLGDF